MDKASMFVISETRDGVTHEPISRRVLLSMPHLAEHLIDLDANGGLQVRRIGMETIQHLYIPGEIAAALAAEWEDFQKSCEEWRALSAAEQTERSPSNDIVYGDAEEWNYRAYREEEQRAAERQAETTEAPSEEVPL